MKSTLSAKQWERLLELPVRQLYKQDDRSRVWLVDNDEVPQKVIKRFEYNPLRQRMAYILGVHPAQREITRTYQLAQSGLPVVAVLGLYVQTTGLMGTRVHLATNFQGQSLQQLKQSGAIPDASTAEALLARVGDLVVRLLEGGWLFRDFKTSNIVVDERFEPRLIDTGSARRGQPCQPGQARTRAWYMLRMLDHTMEQDGWDTAARRHTLARALACLCPDPISHAYDRLARIVLK